VVVGFCGGSAGLTAACRDAALFCPTAQRKFWRPQGTEVDLAGEAVQQLVARYTFAANAKVAKFAGEMQKALLDVKA
jgi:hypothetical protein